jgi:membrane protein
VDARNASLRRALDASRRLVLGLADHDAFRSAAAVAFWFFLSLVPLLVLVGFVVGQVARRRGVDALAEPLLQVVPGTAEKIVRGEIERLSGSGSSLAPLGVLGYMWSASTGLHNLLDVFDRAVRAKPRSYWEKRLIAIAWVIVGLAVTCSLAWLLVRLHLWLRPAVAAWSPWIPRTDHSVLRGHAATAGKPPHHDAHSSIEQVVDGGLTLMVGTGALACFYRFTVKHPAGRRRRVWPGTIAAVAAWLTVSWLFGAYAASTTNYALFYGSLAAVAVLLVWLYLTSLCFMVGVEVNAMLEGAKLP